MEQKNWEDFKSDDPMKEENHQKLLANRVYWKKRRKEIAQAKKRKLEQKLTDDANNDISQKKQGAHYLRYHNFYREAKHISLNNFSQTDDKKELLIKYFPKRFGNKGNQPIQNKRAPRVGKIFQHLVDSAEQYKN